MSGIFTESIVEQATVAWIESLGWRVTHVFDIAPGESKAVRFIGRAV